ncbi:MAG: GntR family transcriptional regulator [Planctomycetota bacterium]|nr:GntR family transcriptional regulator [Planctomycetota bacterium]
MRRRTKKPNYLIAQAKIVRLLRCGRYKIGDALPSLSSLTAQTGLGRISIYQAVRRLAAKGFLASIPGSGYYVKSIPPAEADQQPEGILPRGGDIHVGRSGFRIAQKVIRWGILGELPAYAPQWQSVALAFMREHPTIRLDLVPIAAVEEIVSGKAFACTDIAQIPICLLPALVASGWLFSPQRAGGFELPADAFYPGFATAAQVNGQTWAVPGVCSVECVFFARSAKTLVRELAAEGFWGRLAALARISKVVPNLGYEAAVINDSTLFGLFLLATAGCSHDYEELRQIPESEFGPFMDRLEPYFTDARIFYQAAEIGHSDLLERFWEGRTPMAFGSSSWFMLFQQHCRFQWSILPHGREPGAGVSADANCHVISAATRYPEECREVLQYLARFETQRALAQQGRIVSHVRACGYLRLPYLDDAALQALLGSLAAGAVLRSADLSALDYMHTIVNLETQRWQRGEYTARECRERLRRKTEWYYAPLRLAAGIAP